MPKDLTAARRRHEDAAPLHEEIPYWGWLGDGRTCLTVGGELVTLAAMETYESSGRPGEYLDYVLERWVRLLSTAGSRTRVYLYLLRRPARDFPAGVARAGPRAELARLALEGRRRFLEPRLQTLDVVVAWSRDARLKQRREKATALQRARQVFGPTAAVSSWALAEIEREAREMADTVDAATGLVADLTPLEILGPERASHVLSELVNAPGRSRGLRFGGDPPLAWGLALSEIEAERSHLRVDGEAVSLHSLLSPPGEARANQLEDVLQLPARTLELSWEWAPYPGDRARKRLRRAQRHFWQKRYSAVSQMTGGGGMVDAAAATEADRIAAAGSELENDGVAYGDLSLCLALHGADEEETERSLGELHRIFGQVDAKLIRERYYQLGAYFARLPGQPRPRQLRKVFVSAGAAGALAPLFGPSRGHPRSRHLDAPSMAVLETRARTAYHYDLFGGSDVGHTLILGSTGSGKSFLLNFLLVNALRYDPRVAVLDLGGSYRWLTRLARGGYLALSPEDSGTALNPFGLEPGERTYRFLSGWVAHLLGTGGYRPDGADSSEIRACVEDLFRRAPRDRRMGTLAGSLPVRMRPALERWHGTGPWAPIFDTAEDSLQVADWQVVDLAGAAQYEDLATASMQYVLERLSAQIEDEAERGRLKILVVDEAWKFLRDPEIAGYLLEACKTWRKRNAALVLATQSAVDVSEGSNAQALLESMPTKLFLPNPSMDAERYQRVFALAPSETDLIRKLQPKRELYLRRAEEAETLQLRVDPRSYWLFTSSPADAAKRERAIAELGLDGALEALARGERQ